MQKHSKIKNDNKEKDIKWRLLSNGFDNNSNFATRGIGLYKNELYIGTQSYNKKRKSHLKTLIGLIGTGNVLPYRFAAKSDGCEVWKYNFKTKNLKPIVGNNKEAMIPAGFGKKSNVSAAAIKEFKDKLYVGTANSPTNGCEIWRYDGDKWEQVISKGFGDPNNYGAWTFQIFKDYLYVGTTNWNNSKNGYCQIWRTNDGEKWEQVVDRGFRDFDDNEKTRNRYIWSMIEYKKTLYAGTYNPHRIFSHKGCQLWKTNDGKNWEKVKLPNGDGFGKGSNYGIRDMEIYDGWLYLGTAVMNPFFGFQIWKYNGEKWVLVTKNKEIEFNHKSNGFNKTFFSNRKHKYAWSMVKTTDNKLYLGCLNSLEGSIMYRFDNNKWIEIIGENGERPPGLGSKSNMGVRSIIEYPKGSNNIIIGTSTSFLSPKTCQIWLRKNQ